MDAPRVSPFRAMKYLAVFAAPATGIIALQQGGWWTWFPVLFAFGIVPALELFSPSSPANLSQAEEEIVRKDRVYDFLLYLMVPTQWGLIIWFLYGIQDPTLQPFEIAGRIVAAGVGSGVLGINVAHELGHRHTWYERAMAKALLLSSLYMHFYIEHNKGHHRWVSTDQDPASSRRGESLYAFIVRSVVMGYFSAWKIENQRVRKANQPLWSPWHNEMLRFQLLQLALLGGIWLMFDWVTVLYFLGTAAVGISLLESVNYIEHYGLRRKKNTAGGYERTLPIHSWNSNHLLGRILLFELTRHSDHHYMPQRPYQVLRHFDEAPQMPFGYPTMITIATLPPLWFWIMHRHIDRLKRDNVQGAALG